jgi:DNA-binding MarR family transcriptional regulator
MTRLSTVTPNITAPNAARCAATVRRTVSQLCRKLRPSLASDGISMAKLSVIGQINRGGRLSPTELAAREGVKIQSLTRLLAELESKGWVSRVPNKADTRQSLLSLTPAGRKRLTEAAQEQDAALTRIIDNTLSASERFVLLRACVLLDALHDALSKSQPDKGASP